MILSIGKGKDTPYTNNKGEVYVKQGPDKRRVTDNNEILRLFASAGNILTEDGLLTLGGLMYFGKNPRVTARPSI